MTPSELERMEKSLQERAEAESADALDNVREAERIIRPKGGTGWPLHRSTRGQWESQSKGGLSMPRRKR